MNKTKAKKEAILDPFETELENSFSNDSWVEVTDSKERQKAMMAAKSTKSERTNIRLSLEDIVGIKKKASEHGLGYQTLIASIVHQYVTGRLIAADSVTLSNLVAQTMKQMSSQRKAHAG